jgi:predicted glycosyltransferase involved in capsule biosynthesis
MYNLSIVIPIKVEKKNIFRIQRLDELLQLFVSELYIENIECIVVDSSKSFSSDIQKICQGYQNVHYEYLDMPKVYSAAKARNRGAELSNGNYLLFYDVDLVPTHSFFDMVFNDIESISKEYCAFTIYPCLYLTEKFKNKNIFKQIGTSIKDIEKRYLEGYNDQVLYLAVNTSTILLSRQYFLEIGGYDQNFQGHGYEDFELIHRLYMAYPIIERMDDYPIDYKTPFPTEYKGFRKYFAYYALENFFKGAYTLHLWHPRPLSNKYYKVRKENALYFSNLLKNSMSSKITQRYIDKSLPNDIQEYIKSLCKKYEFDKNYCIGFYRLNKQANHLQHTNLLYRKLRKLILNPKQFVKDIKILKF